MGSLALQKKMKYYEANFKLIHNYNTSKFITRKLNKADRLHALILHYVYMLAKSGNNESAYRLTSLWIFMHKWRATNMVPHLTRRHCEDDCLLATKQIISQRLRKNQSYNTVTARYKMKCN